MFSTQATRAWQPYTCSVSFLWCVRPGVRTQGGYKTTQSNSDWLVFFALRKKLNQSHVLGTNAFLLGSGGDEAQAALLSQQRIAPGKSCSQILLYWEQLAAARLAAACAGRCRAYLCGSQ